MSAVNTDCASVNKPFETLQAQAALAGYTCFQTTVGNIILCRSGGSWIFDRVDLAASWLGRTQVGQ